MQFFRNICLTRLQSKMLLMVRSSMCLSSQLDHQQEPFKLCMHNLAHPTNNGNSQEWLLEREEEENEFRDQFITIVNKRYCFSSIRI